MQEHFLSVGNNWEVNPIRKSSYFYQQLFDSPRKQIKVSTLFLRIADNSRISIKIILYKGDVAS